MKCSLHHPFSYPEWSLRHTLKVQSSKIKSRLLLLPTLDHTDVSLMGVLLERLVEEPGRRSVSQRQQEAVANLYHIPDRISCPRSESSAVRMQSRLLHY